MPSALTSVKRVHCRKKRERKLPPLFHKRRKAKASSRKRAGLTVKKYTSEELDVIEKNHKDFLKEQENAKV